VISHILSKEENIKRAHKSRGKNPDAPESISGKAIAKPNKKKEKKKKEKAAH